MAWITGQCRQAPDSEFRSGSGKSGKSEVLHGNS